MIQLTVGFQERPATKRSDSEFASSITFRDRSRESNFAVVHDRISMPCQESAPRKVILLANSDFHIYFPTSNR
jgi:hypothetical protein